MNLITEVRAQEPYADQPPAEPGFSISSFVPLILIFAIFYFLIIRPQNKKMKDHQLLLKSVKKGDNIVTNSGIYGKVIAIDEKNNTAEIEISEDVTIKIIKSYITDITDKKKKK